MASHPSPFHRNRQNNKALDPNDQTAKFLYTMLKQLDLKNLDWNEVAGGLGITNGHAARMRWSRFRAQIEGHENSYSRQPARKRDGEKKRRRERQDDAAAVNGKEEGRDAERKMVKFEPGSSIKQEPLIGSDAQGTTKNFGPVKNEPPEATSVVDGINVHHPTMTTIEVPQPVTEMSVVERPFDTAKNGKFRGITPAANGMGFEQPVYQPTAPSGLSTTGYWPQQSSATGYMTPSYPIAANTGGHYPFLSNYAYYQQPNMRPNQYGPQRYNPITQRVQNRVQQPIPCSLNALSATQTAASTNISIFTPQSNTPLPQPQHLEPFRSSTLPANHMPTPGLSPAPIAARACELAAEASYPWPYSEASLPDFCHEPMIQSGSQADPFEIIVDCSTADGGIIQGGTVADASAVSSTMLVKDVDSVFHATQIADGKSALASGMQQAALQDQSGEDACIQIAATSPIKRESES